MKKHIVGDFHIVFTKTLDDDNYFILKMELVCIVNGVWKHQDKIECEEYSPDEWQERTETGISTHDTVKEALASMYNVLCRKAHKKYARIQKNEEDIAAELKRLGFEE